MSKRGWIAAIIVIIVGGLSFSAARYFLSSRNPKIKNVVSPEALTEPARKSTEPSQISNKTYQDESGFSFTYPGDLIVEDKTLDDGIHYSLLSVKNAGGETARIRVKDVGYQTVAGWVEQEADSPKNAESGGDIKLGNLSGKRFETPVKLFTVAVDQKILYEIVSPNTPVWQTIYDLIVSSFALGVKPQAGPDGASNNTIYEAEEVVE